MIEIYNAKTDETATVSSRYFVEELLPQLVYLIRRDGTDFTFAVLTSGCSWQAIDTINALTLHSSSSVKDYGVLKNNSSDAQAEYRYTLNADNTLSVYKLYYDTLDGTITDCLLGTFDPLSENAESEVLEIVNHPLAKTSSPNLIGFFFNSVLAASSDDAYARLDTIVHNLADNNRELASVIASTDSSLVAGKELESAFAAITAGVPAADVFA